LKQPVQVPDARQALRQQDTKRFLCLGIRVLPYLWQPSFKKLESPLN